MPQVHITYQGDLRTVRYVARSPDNQVHRVYVTAIPSGQLEDAIKKAEEMAQDQETPGILVVRWAT